MCVFCIFWKVFQSLASEHSRVRISSSLFAFCEVNFSFVKLLSVRIRKMRSWSFILYYESFQIFLIKNTKGLCLARQLRKRGKRIKNNSVLKSFSLRSQFVTRLLKAEATVPGDHCPVHFFTEYPYFKDMYICSW